jgi:hypothetical protein
MPINKYIYTVIFILLLGAWFSDFRMPSAPKPRGVGQEPTRIVTNLEETGVKNQDLHTGGKCNIEFINGTSMDDKPYSIGREGGLILTGWALDAEKRRLPKTILIRFTDNKSNQEFFAKAQTGIKRPDVQAHFKLPTDLVASGFRLITYLKDIALGEYEITLLAIYPDDAYVCSNGRKIYVR